MSGVLDCFHCDEDDCDACEEYTEVHDLADEDDDGDKWECIGPECLNPHVVHMRSECFTLEMAEAAQGTDATNAEKLPARRVEED